LAGARDGPLVAVAGNDGAVGVLVVNLDVEVGGVDVQALQDRVTLGVADLDVHVARIAVVVADLDVELVAVVVHGAADRGEFAVNVVAGDLHDGRLLAQRGLGGGRGGVAVGGRGGVVLVLDGFGGLVGLGGVGDDGFVIVAGAGGHRQGQGRDGQQNGGPVAELHGGTSSIGFVRPRTTPRPDRVRGEWAALHSFFT